MNNLLRDHNQRVLSGCGLRQRRRSSQFAQLAGQAQLLQPLALGGLRLGYELQYDARRLSKDGTALDGYWLSNLNLIADKWVQGLEVSLGIRNLLDQDYQHPGSPSNWQNALEQDGRSVRVNLEYRF